MLFCKSIIIVTHLYAAVVKIGLSRRLSQHVKLTKEDMRKMTLPSRHRIRNYLGNSQITKLLDVLE